MKPSHISILSLLILHTFYFSTSKAATFYEIDNTESGTTTTNCVTNGSFDCSVCACNFAEPQPFLVITLCVLSILFSLFFIFGFITSKEFREKPGDILFAISVADLLYAIGRIFATITYESSGLTTDDNRTVCGVSSVINILAISMTKAYQLSFFFYYLTILRSSLKGVKIPDIFYHLIPLLVTAIFIYYTIDQGQVGRSIFGICVLRTSPGMLTPILTNGIFLVVIYYFAIQTSRSLPEAEKVSQIRAQFMRFYYRYLIAISILYVAKGIADAMIGRLVSNLAENTSNQSQIDQLKVMKTVTEILTGLSPIVLMVGRMTDPLIRAYIMKVFSKGRDTKGTELNSESTLDASLKRETVELELTLASSSTLEQFKQSRRVEVLYSLLSGIHYFWHVKKMNKLIELEPLKFSYDENDPNEDYLKESKNIRTLFVQKDTLINQVPELFAEIKEKHYNLARGILTAHAPRLFEEIIELDDTGRGIRKSLDLKQNFKRIVKSGINGGGKSGEFFFFSDDNRFIIKTVSEGELNVFKMILASYAKYLKLNPNSIIAKIYGVFTFEIEEPNEKYHLILMKNINGYPSNCVDRKYDLKGSTVGRIAIKDSNVTITDLKERGVLKDLDFDKFEKKIHIDPEISKKLYEALQKDIQFLSSMQLVDYSLAVYVIDRSLWTRPEEQEDQSPKRISKTVKDGESLVAIKSTAEEKYYHIGIIDYLIRFNIKKKSEVFFKKLGAFDPNLDISVQHPSKYGSRFIGYMEKILP